MGSSPPGHLRSIPETTLRGVLARYGLDNDVAIVPMEASKRNDNFVVQGTGGKWVLRRYRRNNDEARVRFQLRFQQHLSDSGFPTSEISPSKTGDQLVCDESGLWSLFTFIQGNEFDFSRLIKWLRRPSDWPSSITEPPRLTSQKSCSTLTGSGAIGGTTAMSQSPSWRRCSRVAAWRTISHSSAIGTRRQFATVQRIGWSACLTVGSTAIGTGATWFSSATRSGVSLTSILSAVASSSRT